VNLLHTVRLAFQSAMIRFALHTFHGQHSFRTKAFQCCSDALFLLYGHSSLGLPFTQLILEKNRHCHIIIIIISTNATILFYPPPRLCRRFAKPLIEILTRLDAYFQKCRSFGNALHGGPFHLLFRCKASFVGQTPGTNTAGSSNTVRALQY
jgi:hypothetical protein